MILLNNFMDIYEAYRIIKESKINQFSGAGIIFFDGERILLLKKKNKKWGFIGGKPVEEETPYQTAIRETKEEIGCIHGEKIKELKIKIKGSSYYTYIFKVKEKFDDISLSEEHVDYSWISLNNLKKMRLSRMFKICLNDILKALKNIK
jgi:8-oxo-dGTP pyrophosphatase MutT (NUDIX family)